MTAIYWAYHALHDHSPIFNDFLAQQIIEEGEMAAFEQKLVAALKSSNPSLRPPFLTRQLS
ncbi:MAG TPA: hypothetical protein VN374_00660 [Desulfitobacteriaceae bacterium]|nr:hypothetical protein [Desulfitobacteriaceae bacterium]